MGGELMELSYDINWEKTIEHIRFLLRGRTCAKYFSDIFGVSERAAEYKLMSPFKSELSIKELVILARYFRCDILELLVFEGEPYIAPEYDDTGTIAKEEIENTSAEEVNKTVDALRKIDESYEIRDLYELLLYLPLIDEAGLRDVICRCSGNLEWHQRDYVKRQLTYLYKQIPESPQKRYADGYRDNVLRVKGHPGNNLYDLHENNYKKEYRSNLKRYRQEGNKDLYKGKSMTVCHVLKSFMIILSLRRNI